MVATNALIVEDNNMGMELIPFLVKKKINRYPDIKYDDLQLVNYVKSDIENIRINLILPTMNKKSIYGGISTALNFFNSIADAYNAEKRIIVTDADVDAESEKDYKHWNFISPDRDMLCNEKITLCEMTIKNRQTKKLAVRKNDFFITTSWKTKYVFENITSFQREKYKIDRPVLYFIQDYEPGFYAWSTNSCLADSTYKDGNSIAVFNSESLKNYFKLLGYKFRAELSFDPILNHNMAQILQKAETVPRQNRILFYGRPFEERNCFALGVEAMKAYIKKYHPDHSWKFISMGAWHREVKLADGFTLCSNGKMSLEAYANYLLESKVGVSLMCSPHPSYPPLEMATFGVKTVTNAYICKNLKDFNENIVSVERMDIDSLADAIHKAVSLSEKGTQLYKGTPYAVGKDQFEDIIKKLLESWR